MGARCLLAYRRGRRGPDAVAGAMLEAEFMSRVIAALTPKK